MIPAPPKVHSHLRRLNHSQVEVIVPTRSCSPTSCTPITDIPHSCSHPSVFTDDSSLHFQKLTARFGLFHVWDSIPTLQNCTCFSDESVVSLNWFHLVLQVCNSILDWTQTNKKSVHLWNFDSKTSFIVLWKNIFTTFEVQTELLFVKWWILTLKANYNFWTTKKRKRKCIQVKIHFIYFIEFLFLNIWRKL